MAVELTIQNRQRTRRVKVALLRRIAKHLLAEELNLLSAQLGVTLVADDEMAALNESFLQHAGSTDVITFDYSERESRNSKLETGIHGEILVCVDEAVRQAKRFKTSWQSEIVRYTVHGVLHLLGHDDKRVPARKKMKREENRLVAALAKEFPLSKLALPA
ncbi:MAG: rRNA maturation RNase YbeY [Verrucomicrobia bacterium]|nr:MAG: rRNA maturation RNase YbeY [Verrucomicrobiota bacterium]